MFPLFVASLNRALIALIAVFAALVAVFAKSEITK